MPLRVNVTTKVNSKTIRKEMINGREHWVVPSYTLPANVVMNGGLYPAAEIDANYQKLDGTLAPLGHPNVNGQFISAFTPEAINANHVGAWNRNVKKSGNRIYVEKVIDIEVASQTENGRRLLERLEALANGDDVPPIHTSVAVYLDQIEANEQQKKGGYDWIAKIHGMDHDAILLDEVGAATPEQGVGMMVNADQAQPLQANVGAFTEMSYRERENLLDQAARERFPNISAWCADFTEKQAVIFRDNSEPEVFDYTIESGKAVLSDTGTKVQRQTFWQPIVNKLKSLFQPTQARPASNEKEGDMPLSKEDKDELNAQLKELSANMAKAITETVKPLADQVSALQANQKALTDQLTANERAADEAKRKEVAAAYGDIVANSLHGEALDAMHKKIGSAAPLAGGDLNTNSGKETVAPTDLGAYFGVGVK